jgi:hypothetical protein
MNSILLRSLFLCLLFIGKISFAQDLIVYKNGDEVKAKVLSVNREDISYKKWDNVEGPTYTISIDEVFMIKYKNGTKDVFSKSTTPQPQNVESVVVKENKISDETNIKVRSNSEKYCKLKGHYLGKGIAVSVIAPIFLITGVSLFTNGYAEYNAFGSAVVDDVILAKMGIGAGLSILSIPMFIAIPISFKKFSDFNDKCKKSSVRVRIAPSFDIANHKTFTNSKTVVGLKLSANF